MNLVIDQGNSFTKIGIFEHYDLIRHMVLSTEEVPVVLNGLFSQYAINNSILSSVINTSEEVICLLREKSTMFIELDHHTPLPVKNCYGNPAKLGKDRIAVAVAANYLKPDTNCLIIDAGTTITYEFVTQNAEYLGGNISPGMQMRFKALNNYTQKLPLVEYSKDYHLLGNDTVSAILSGVVNGITFEMDGYIDVLKGKYPDLSIFLTGGDTFFFETTLKNSIFAHKNLLLTGLNRILNYNA